jgi:hypothetical protein
LADDIVVRIWRTLDSVMELAFLQDIFAFPDGGVAERYKRLGLSVRQGQKIKANLAGRGLIQEKIEMVRTGKLRVIRLTDQGRLAIEQLENRPSEAA